MLSEIIESGVGMSQNKFRLIGMVLVATTAWAQATGHYPVIVHADLPLYPPIAQTAHITGTVEIQVVVERARSWTHKLSRSLSAATMVPR